MRAILTWHSVDPSGSPISVNRDEFGRQVAWLSSGAVRVVGIEELCQLPDEAAAVALTFDDGYANLATEAAPLLQEHGLPATVFVVSGYVGLDNGWSRGRDPGIPVLPLLDWDALGRLRESGVTLGAHSRTHARLTRLNRSALEAELLLAADEMEHRLGQRPAGLAYPYGAVNDEVAGIAGRWYRWACTTELRSLRRSDSALRLPRLDARYLRNQQVLEAWGSGQFRVRLWARRQARRLHGH